jgi:hypothetical protein
MDDVFRSSGCDEVIDGIWDNSCLCIFSSGTRDILFAASIVSKPMKYKLCL